MSSTFTPFGLQQVVPIVNPDGSIGWEFLGGVTLQELLNPLSGGSVTAQSISEGAVSWSKSRDANGYPPEMVSGGENTIQLLASYLTAAQRGATGATFQSVAQVKAQDNTHGNFSSLDLAGDGTVVLQSSLRGDINLVDAVGNSDFALHSHIRIPFQWSNGAAAGTSNLKTFTSNGGPTLIVMGGTSFGLANTHYAPALTAYFDGNQMGTVDYYCNVGGQHLVLPFFVGIETPSIGNHNVGLISHMSFDASDTTWGFGIEVPA